MKKKDETPEWVQYVVDEWDKAKTVKAHKTHKVVNNNGEVEHTGTRESCKLYVAANAPLGRWCGITYKIRKMKTA